MPPPAGSANNLWTHLTIRPSHGAYPIRPCPFLVQAQRGSTGPSPAPPEPQPPPEGSGLSQPLPQSQISSTLPFSEPGYRQARRSPGALRWPIGERLPTLSGAPRGHLPYARREGGLASTPAPAVAPQLSPLSPAPTLWAAQSSRGRRHPALSAPTERAHRVPRALPSLPAARRVRPALHPAVLTGLAQPPAETTVPPARPPPPPTRARWARRPPLPASLGEHSAPRPPA